MKKWLFRLCLIAILPIPLVSAGELERIAAKGEIVVSLNQGYPPFAMEVDGRLAGLDVDLATTMAGYLGVKVRFVRPERYEDQIPMLLAGGSDIIIAAMTRTVERGLLVNFSDPYFEVSQAALVWRDRLDKEADSYFDLTEIPDLKLGVKAGTTHEKFARELFDAQAIRTYPTAAAAADALAAGAIDAMAADSPFVEVWRASHPQQYTRIKALLAPVTSETYGFAIRKGDPDFLAWINLFIARIQEDGTLELLKYEYFDRMAWAGIVPVPGENLNKATFLKNKFIQKKKDVLERQRRERAERGDAYE